jgi:hypothetical protein
MAHLSFCLRQGANVSDTSATQDAPGPSGPIRHDALQDVCRRFPLLAGNRVTLEADLNGRDWLQTLQAADWDPAGEYSSWQCWDSAADAATATTSGHWIQTDADRCQS